MKRSPHHGLTVLVGCRLPPWLADAADERARLEAAARGSKSPGRGWGLRALAAEGLSARGRDDG